MDYIDRLIAMRIDHDLSQKTVASVLNKSQQGYDHIEKRRAKLSVEDFMKLCEFYNTDPRYFLGYTHDNNPLWDNNKAAAVQSKE
jgi:transcriptional regulator with XRE-family HTH domain